MMAANLPIALMLAGLVVFSALSVIAEIEENTPNKVQPREGQGKVFSLFSIVTFKNKGCQTQSGTTTTTARNRNGTCYTSTECANKGGKASGNCASGFGVCCLFVVSAGSSVISENCSYIQNPGYPTVYSATTGLTYTVRKCSNDVCGLRLDFESFTLESLTAFGDNGACKDTFIIAASPSTFAYPTICGRNTGQHVYVDLGGSNTAFATLSFAFDAAASTLRQWEIKVTQISCFQQDRPFNPSCFQYHTGLTGRIESFNFQEPTTTLQTHLPSQDYNVCIRQEQGYCCVQYSICTDTNSYHFDFAGTAPTTAVTGSLCSKDFIGISGGSSLCTVATTGNSLGTKFCGKYFSEQQALTLSTPVCDCTAPFTVNVLFDAPAAAAEGTSNQRGVCLDYTQIPCQPR